MLNTSHKIVGDQIFKKKCLNKYLTTQGTVNNGQAKQNILPEKMSTFIILKNPPI